MMERSLPDRGDVNQRVRRSKETVLATTFQLMSEAGIGGVSIDEVARRSGVAKTTIYRHWPSRSALLLDACSKMGSRPEVPDTGSLRGDVTALVANLAHQLQSARWPTILPSIVDAAERDPELAELQGRLQAGFTAPYLSVLERARRRGELPQGQSPANIVASIIGPFFYRRWFSREPVDEKFVKSVVANLIARLKPRH
jgi:AcrR family transcriptional regulator